jgi:hypothetical protein
MKRLKSKFRHFKPAMSAGIGCILVFGSRYPARADAPKTLGAWQEQVGKVAALPVPTTSEEIEALPEETRKSEAASLLALGRSTINNFVHRLDDPECKYGGIYYPHGENYIYDGSQGYYPRLLAATCYYRAALLLKRDDAQRADAFANVVDLLLPVYKQVNGIYVADKDVFNDIYNSPIVLRILIESAVGARQGGLRFIEPSAPQRLLKWLQTLTYQERHSLVKVDKTTVEGLVALLGPNAEKLHPGAADLLALGVNKDKRENYLVGLRDGTKRELLTILKGARVPVEIAPDVQTGPNGSVLSTEIHPLVPMNVAIVDTAAQRDQDKTQTALTSDQSMTFTLKDPQVETIVARWTVEDDPKFPIDAEYKQALDGQTQPFTVDVPPKLADPARPQIDIAGRTVSGANAIAYAVEKARAGDQLIVQVNDEAKPRFIIALDKPTGTVPDFLVPAYRPSTVKLFVRRKERDYPGHTIAIVSQPRPTIVADLHRVGDIPVLRVSYTDYKPLSTLAIGGVPWQLAERMQTTHTNEADPDVNVIYLPLPGVTGKVALTINGEPVTANEVAPETDPDRDKIAAYFKGLPDNSPVLKAERLLVEHSPNAEDAYFVLVKIEGYKIEAEQVLRGFYKNRLDAMLKLAPKERRETLTAFKTSPLVLHFDTGAEVQGYIDSTDVPRGIKLLAVVSDPAADAKTPGLTWVRFRLTDQLQGDKITGFGVQVSGTVYTVDAMPKAGQSTVAGMVEADGVTVDLLAPVQSRQSMTLSITFKNAKGEEAANPATVKETDYSKDPLTPDTFPQELKALRDQYTLAATPFNGDVKTLAVGLQPAALGVAELKVRELIAGITPNAPADQVTAALDAAKKLNAFPVSNVAGASEMKAEMDRIRQQLLQKLTPVAAPDLPPLTRDGAQLVNRQITLASPAPGGVLTLKVPGQQEEVQGVKNGNSFTFTLPETTEVQGDQLAVTPELHLPGLGDLEGQRQLLRLKQKDLTPLALQIQSPEREAVADLRANHEIDVKAPILDTKAGALGVMLLDDADQPLDSNGNPLPANQPPAFQIVDANTVRQNNNTIKLSVGNLQPGSYRVKVAAWENARPAPNLTPGATQEKSLKVLGPGVALIVANDYYNDPDHLFPPLRHAVHDGRAIKQLLHKLGYLDDNIIYVFGSVDKNGQSHLDTNWCPDRLKARLLLKYHDRVTDSLINDAIGTLTQRASDIKATHALIFYAGHGKTFKAEGASFAENRFVCWHGEAAGGDKVNWSYVQVSPQQAVPDLVHDLTAPPGADKPTIIGIYDACRNAGNNVQVVDPPPPAGVNFFSLYSCGSSEQANEDPDNDPKMSLDIHHGFFTYALLQEFANAEKAGKVDILTLGDVVKGASAELNQLTQSAEAKWKDVPGYFHPQHLVDVGDLTNNQKPLPVFVRIGPEQAGLVKQEQRNLVEDPALRPANRQVALLPQR